MLVLGSALIDRTCSHRYWTEMIDAADRAMQLLQPLLCLVLRSGLRGLGLRSVGWRIGGLLLGAAWRRREVCWASSLR